jgi:hypothetical protein
MFLSELDEHEVPSSSLNNRFPYKKEEGARPSSFYISSFRHRLKNQVKSLIQSLYPSSKFGSLGCTANSNHIRSQAHINFS